MQTKLFEVRDKGTIIPVVAMSLRPQNEGQKWLVWKAGYGRGDSGGGAFTVMLGRLVGNGPFTGDPYAWNNRTMHNAHLYIQDHFDELNDGDVVDVQFILGETDKPKISERFAE